MHFPSLLTSPCFISLQSYEFKGLIPDSLNAFPSSPGFSVPSTTQSLYLIQPPGGAPDAQASHCRSSSILCQVLYWKRAITIFYRKCFVPVRLCSRPVSFLLKCTFFKCVCDDCCWDSAFACACIQAPIYCMRRNMFYIYYFNVTMYAFT